jgi:hypothetical protein
MLAIIIPLTNMHISTFFLLIGLSCLVAAQSYALEDDYESDSFFDMFDFFTVSTMSIDLIHASDSFTGS